jgi:hypothetical protein
MTPAIVAIFRSAPLPVWAARATGLLLPQGIVVLVIYAVFGFDLPLDSMPLGLRIDPLHAVMHIIWGTAGLLIGFRRPQWAIPWLIIFGIYYVAMSMLGFFTHTHFGLHLGPRENSFHLFIGAGAFLFGIYSAVRWRGAQ